MGLCRMSLNKMCISSSRLHPPCTKVDKNCRSTLLGTCLKHRSSKRSKLNQKNDGIYHSWIESPQKKVSVKLIGNGPKNTSKFSAGPGDFSSDFLGFPPAGFVAVGAWKASNSWALKDVLVSYDRNSSMGKSHGLQGGRLRIDPLFIYLFYISSNWICWYAIVCPNQLVPHAKFIIFRGFFSPATSSAADWPKMSPAVQPSDRDVCRWNLQGSLYYQPKQCTSLSRRNSSKLS